MSDPVEMLKRYVANPWVVFSPEEISEALRTVLERLEAAEADPQLNASALNDRIVELEAEVERLRATVCTDECVAVEEYDRVLAEVERLRALIEAARKALTLFRHRCHIDHMISTVDFSGEAEEAWEALVEALRGEEP